MSFSYHCYHYVDWNIVWLLIFEKAGETITKQTTQSEKDQQTERRRRQGEVLESDPVMRTHHSISTHPYGVFLVEKNISVIKNKNMRDSVSVKIT